jgi:pSer/pThr/pTyr-binding forkhead associated (FHA) protein
MKDKLRQIEEQLQHVIEKQAFRLLNIPDMEATLAQRLVQAMEDKIRVEGGGEMLAPNIYTLNVAPKYAPDVRTNQGLLDKLAGTLRSAGQEAGIAFESALTFNIFPDEDVNEGEFSIHAMWNDAKLDETQEMGQLPEETRTEKIPRKAFLIVGGSQIFSLDQGVINIGRKLDNQLVIDDPRVSRRHAQLRVVKGYYMIFDLDSSGGTFVNGDRISQETLHPGDVISLAGVPMVYGQDAVRAIDETIEYKQPKNTSDRTTAANLIDDFDLDTFDQ